MTSLAKILLSLTLIAAGLTGFLAAGPAAASEYTMENRAVVAFPGPKGGVIHQSPYPQNWRSGAVLANDSCWRECTATCNARMAACTPATGADACRPYLDGCDRSCQRSCRSIWAKPILDFIDW